ISVEEKSRIILDTNMRTKTILIFRLGWVGYNAEIVKDNSSIQKVEYLIQINDTLTDPAVIALRIQSAEEWFYKFVLTGKHFNRFKKIHPLLFLALQNLHFKRFLQKQDQNLENIKQYLQTFNEKPNENPQIVNEELQKLFDKYEQYKTETLQGKYA
ncbi:hypothetical protein PV326_007564, partial [Microctonus aethiopoides]